MMGLSEEYKELVRQSLHWQLFVMILISCDQDDFQVNIAMTATYMIFGLSLFWMVFHLVQVFSSPLDGFTLICIFGGHSPR